MPDYLRESSPRFVFRSESVARCQPVRDAQNSRVLVSAKPVARYHKATLDRDRMALPSHKTVSRAQFAFAPQKMLESP